jgi:hypothetical protein
MFSRSIDASRGVVFVALNDVGTKNYFESNAELKAFFIGTQDPNS